jgi:hypothetical protein
VVIVEEDVVSQAVRQDNTYTQVGLARLPFAQTYFLLTIVPRHREEALIFGHPDGTLLDCEHESLGKTNMRNAPRIQPHIPRCALLFRLHLF